MRKQHGVGHATRCPASPRPARVVGSRFLSFQSSWQCGASNLRAHPPCTGPHSPVTEHTALGAPVSSGSQVAVHAWPGAVELPHENVAFSTAAGLPGHGRAAGTTGRCPDPQAHTRCLSIITEQVCGQQCACYQCQGTPGMHAQCMLWGFQWQPLSTGQTRELPWP